MFNHAAIEVPPHDYGKLHIRSNVVSEPWAEPRNRIDSDSCDWLWDVVHYVAYLDTKRCQMQCQDLSVSSDIISSNIYIYISADDDISLEYIIDKTTSLGIYIIGIYKWYITLWS